MAKRGTAAKNTRTNDGRSRGQSEAPAPSQQGASSWFLVGGGVVAALLVVGIALGAFGGGSTGSKEQANGGSWTNVDANQLATMMKAKDFTLLNVKTPYIGEIEGTDLYIPYDQIAGRAAELPQDKSAKIVIYCRAGNESRVAAQTLIDMGYTNLYNLDKGMESWTGAGYQLVNKGRS